MGATQRSCLLTVLEQGQPHRLSFTLPGVLKSLSWFWADPKYPRYFFSVPSPKPSVGPCRLVHCFKGLPSGLTSQPPLHGHLFLCIFVMFSQAQKIFLRHMGALTCWSPPEEFILPFCTEEGGSSFSWGGHHTPRGYLKIHVSTDTGPITPWHGSGCCQRRGAGQGGGRR